MIQVNYSGDGRMGLVFSVRLLKDLMMNLFKNIPFMTKFSIILLSFKSLLKLLLSKKNALIKSIISKICGKMIELNMSGIKKIKWQLKKLLIKTLLPLSLN